MDVDVSVGAFGDFRYGVSLLDGLYVETCTSFFVLSGPRWLTDRIGNWNPARYLGVVN